MSQLEKQVNEQESVNSTLTQEAAESKTACETVKKEQEDLFLLLSDLEEKVDKYKTKLKELGTEVRLGISKVKSSMIKITKVILFLR